MANKLYLPVNGAFPFPFATAHETCRKVYNENIFSLVLLGKTTKIEKPAREMAKGKGNSNSNGNLLFNSPNCQLHNPKHTFSPTETHTPYTYKLFSLVVLLSILLFSTLLSLLKLNFTHFSFILFSHISLLKLSDAADSFVCLSCPSKWPHLFSIATPWPPPHLSLSLSSFLSCCQTMAKKFAQFVFVVSVYCIRCVFIPHKYDKVCVNLCMYVRMCVSVCERIL